MSAQTVNIPNGGAGFDDALQDALRQCLLLPDYDQAAARWLQMTRLLRKLGCPQDLYEKYEDMLLDYFEQKRHADDHPYQQMINSNGGTINIYTGKREVPIKKTITTEQIVDAIHQCQSYMWGNSSLATIFCICREYYGLVDNMSQFEREMQRFDIECPTGTIDGTIRKNPYMRYPIEKWAEKGAKERVMKLVEAFRKIVEGK